jgi:hypothetical protein
MDVPFERRCLTVNLAAKVRDEGEKWRKQDVEFLR